MLATPCPTCRTPVQHGNQCSTCANKLTVSFDVQREITPPVIYQNPTAQDLYNALLTKKNPYADWGMLLYDDSQKQMWPVKYALTSSSYSYEKTGSSQEYMGNTYKIYMRGCSVPVCSQAVGNASLLTEAVSATHIVQSLPKQTFWQKLWGSTVQHPPTPIPPTEAASITQALNFAFQTQMKMQNAYDGSLAGIILRADNSGRSYYCLTLNKDSEIKFSTENQEPLFKEKVKANPENPNVLTIVMQEYAIHIYVNLQLITAIDDMNIIRPGNFGLYFNSPVGSVDFSHTKIWIK